jgi:hypothetical protein
MENADKKFVVVNEDGRVSRQVHESTDNAEQEKKKIVEQSQKIQDNLQVKQVLLG